MSKKGRKIWAFGLVLCMISTLFPTNIVPIYADSSTVQASEDVCKYIQAGTPPSISIFNNGTDVYFDSGKHEMLVGDYSNGQEHFTSAFKFDLSSYTGKKITSAQLYVYIEDKQGTPAISVSGSTDTTWVEGSALTNFPSSKANILYEKSEDNCNIPSSGWYTINFGSAGISYLNSAISEKVATFIIDGSTSNANLFGISPKMVDGALNNYRPQLIMECTTTLSKVSNVKLSNQGIASWDDVDYESGYSVQLLKNGVAIGSPITTSANVTNHDFLTNMRTGGVGTYTVQVTATGDGSNYSDGIASDASTGEDITKADTVTGGLTWSGDVANWTSVGATSYDVQLYKDASALGSAKNITAANAASGADFSSEIANGGGGTYTYKVTAKGDEKLVLDADQSATSNANKKASQLTQVSKPSFSSSGVATWTNVSHASNYSVQLYKSGSAQGSAVTVNSGATGNDFLSTMRSVGAGDYTVKVTAVGDVTNYTNATESTASDVQTIIQLPTVTSGITWSANVAHWNSISNAVSYDVQLYKDASALGSAKNITAANAASGADFSSEIAAAGGGSYTYKVTAKGNTTLILDASQSGVSNINLKATQLAKVTGVTLASSGIASWNSVTNASSYTVKLYNDGTYTGNSNSTTATSLDLLSIMRACGAGNYTVKVTAKGDGTTYSDATESDTSISQTIIYLDTVESLIWSSNTATWSEVTDAVSYDVQLYKNGYAVSGAVKNVLAADRAAGVDFSSQISSNGGGMYTFTVTAKGDNKLIVDADTSTQSWRNVIADPLDQVMNVQLSDAGVASWRDVIHEMGFSVQLYQNGNAIGSPVTISRFTLSHNFLSAIRAGGVGSYTVKVTAKGDGTHYSDSLPSFSSPSRSTTTLSTCDSGTWSGNVAHFSSVTDASSYDVQLYKDGSKVTAALKSIDAVNMAGGVDFASDIAAEGAGVYTFTVTAKGNGLFILDGAESVESSKNIVAAPLLQVTGVALSADGVATWNDVSHEVSYSIQLYKDSIAQGSAVIENADTVTHDFLTDMRNAGAGVYTVKVTAIGDETNYADGLQSVASGSQTIIKPDKVDGLNWVSDTAYFHTVPDASRYAVQLYKNGLGQGLPKIINSSDALFGADFSSEIMAGGVGKYTFCVTAIGDTSLVLNADESEQSAEKINAVILSQVTGVTLSDSGVVSWSDVDHETGYLVQLYKDGVPYGVPVFKNADDTSYDFLSAIRAGGAGVYSVAVTAKGDGVYYLDALASASSAGQTLAKIATVSNGLIWSNTTANWSPVANATSYAVQLYKNGIAIGTPVNVLANNAGSGVDFNASIQMNGFGTYTYKVTANGNTSLLLDAEQSAFSNDYVKQTKESTVTFDQNDASKNNQNISVPLLLDTKILDSVKNGSTILKVNVDYTIADNTITIRKEYLKTLKTGTYTFTIIFKNGDTQTVTVNVVNSQNTSPEKPTPTNPSSETPATPSKTNQGQTSATVPTASQTPAVNQVMTGSQTAPTNQSSPSPQATSATESQNGTGDFEVKTESDEKTPAFSTPSNEEVYDAVLTQDDKAAIAAGEKVTVKVVVEAVEQPADGNIVKENLGDQTFGMFMDISVLKTIGETQSQIHELNKPITLTFDIPKVLRGKPKYAIIRVHNGVSTVLNDEDDNPDTVTFRTDRFSTYALVYEASQNATTEMTVTPNNNHSYVIWIILGTVIAAGFFFFILLKRRKKEDEEVQK